MQSHQLGAAVAAPESESKSEQAEAPPHGGQRLVLIKTQAVTGRTIAEETVTSGKIANESIVSSKLSAALYAQLVRNVAYFDASSPSDSEANKSATINCPSGKQAIGGGVRLEGELAEVAVTGSYPVSSQRAVPVPVVRRARSGGPFACLWTPRSRPK